MVCSNLGERETVFKMAVTTIRGSDNELVNEIGCEACKTLASVNWRGVSTVLST